MHFHTPHEARLAGIGIIYQELTVAPNLTVSGNVFLGSEARRFGFLKVRLCSRAATAKEISRVLKTGTDDIR